MNDIPKMLILRVITKDLYTFMKLLVHMLLMIVLVLCGIQTQTDAQSLNPPKIQLKTLQGNSNAVLFVSTQPIKIISSNLGSATASIREVNLNLEYELVINTSSNQEGMISVVVEHKEPISDLKYSVVNVKVVKSLLEAKDDFVAIPFGTNSTSLSILSNDVLGTGNTSITNVSMVSNGSAIIQNDEIVFSPASGFSGITTFNYCIQDSKGVKSVANVSVNVQRGTSIGSTTLSYVVSNSSEQVLLIDNSGYQVLEPEELLKGEVITAGDALIYKPKPMASGFESFNLQNTNGDQILVEIEVLRSEPTEDQILDDQYFMTPGASIQFNPRTNDYSQSGIIVGHSAEFSVQNDVFSYTGPASFSGVKAFYYDVLEGTVVSRGYIEIFIGNYLPQHNKYSLQTFKSTPLVIEYNVPIKNFSWSLISGPKNGSVFANLGAYIPTDYCENESGHQMIVYRPNTNFIGIDKFTINYCVDQETCKSVEVSIDVINSTNDCHCIGGDCAWAGDANNDGVVNVADLLSIGYNYGENGNAINSSEKDWYGRSGDDWAFDQLGSTANLKYADSNGDGFIDANDTISIRANIGKAHSLVPAMVTAQKDVAISFVPTAQTANPGDLVTYDIIIGSESNPVKDLRGIVFGFQVPESIVKPGSIKVTFDPTIWFGSNSTSLSMTYLQNSSAEGALTRLNDFGISGKGKIGSTSLVIKESHDGIRPGDKTLNLELAVPMAFISDGSGRMFNVPIKVEPIKIDLNQIKDLSEQASIIVYPNPSVGQMAFHANNNDVIQEVNIYNLLGARVYSEKEINSNVHQLSLNVDNGIYIAEIRSEKGLSTKKIQILNR